MLDGGTAGPLPLFFHPDRAVDLQVFNREGSIGRVGSHALGGVRKGCVLGRKCGSDIGTDMDVKTGFEILAHPGFLWVENRR